MILSLIHIKIVGKCVGMISYETTIQGNFDDIFQSTMGEPQFVSTLEGPKLGSNNLV